MRKCEEVCEMSRVIHEGQYEMWDSLQHDILEKFIGIVHVETKKKKTPCILQVEL